MTLLLFAGFVALILLRVPITMAIGLAVLSALIYAGFSDTLYIIPLQVLDGVDNPSLLAIPFFIMAGNLMNGVGMTDRIFNFASALVGHMRAGLAQVNVVSSLLFAGVSGAAVADCAGLGTIEIKAMRERGYPAPFAAALTAASAVVGPIIPPSISLVVYAFLSNTSVARLFLAGIIPGLIVGMSLMAFNYLVALKQDFPREERKSLPQIGRSAIDGIAALVAPGIILVAILTGFTTATEAGVLACVYTIALGFVYRTFSFRMLWQALTETMTITSVIMIIIGFSHVMGWLLAIEQIPQQLADQILLFTESRTVFLLLLLGFLLLVGCFVEGVPAKLILVPMLLPIIDQFGIDRIHFGLIITLALLIGIATPPMGIALYIVAEVGKVPFEKVAVAILPFLIPLIVALLMITFVPELVLFLPNLVLGPA
ncbi:TRAP-type C4-dicarboxylate transport system, large permease component [Nitratireductor aquibiodomus RA22]|uniref:TRAP transporter large permease protein n=2 Tax=Nitratireductor aquibiodomus TaxID=204799 RepID=A0A1H4QHG0_9HYPH|nr:TRAP transporter large permease [Nitratireductor aquibiodomus]EIM77417.1 TRAP-type C4-dicarboxylate transport system, large permease component [Nitratireductor aquibiodomus RA22]SEC19013.1 TRAP transporter, DctM subunit [Nitratireductor aquibiodomus]